MRRTPVTCLLLAALVCGQAASAAAPQGRLLRLGGAGSLAAGAGSIWVTTPRQLVRIDPSRDTIVTRVALPAIAGSVAVVGRFVWVLTDPVETSPAAAAPGLLWSIDTATNRIVGKPVELSPVAGGGAIVAARGSLWVANGQHGRFGRLYRIDPSTRTIVARIPIPNWPGSVVLAGGLLWVGEADTGKIVRVDPARGAVVGEPISVGGALITLASDAATIWVADDYDGRLASIDARTARVTSSRALPGVSEVSAAGKTVWVTLAKTGELAGFDGDTGLETFSPAVIRGGASGIAAAGKWVWVSNRLGVTRVPAR
jgi:hypothetical protein